MNKGLNVIVIVLVLASIAVGGVSGETSSGIELSEEDIRMVGIGHVDRSDFVVQTPNLANSIFIDKKNNKYDSDGIIIKKLKNQLNIK